MAVNFVMQSSLVQLKPSLFLKTLQNPSLPQLSRLSPPSRVGFLLTKRSGVVGKLSAPSAVPDSAFSVLETKQDSQNPIILIDNYDSFFTSNLCQYMGELGCSLEVCRNDELTMEELKSFGAWTIVPCGAFVRLSEERQYVLHMVLNWATVVVYIIMMRRKLGCLQDCQTHSKLAGVPMPFLIWMVLEALKVTAFTEDGLIMAARHKIYKYLHGVHFSQESIITSEGKIIVKNFIKLIERKEAAESQN